MMTDAGMGRWATAVAHAINHNVKPSEPYMRAFDSGDFLNHRHVRAWSMVADRVFPTVIWDPTRAWRGFVDESTGALRTNLWQAAFREFAAKPNVSCRPSALKYDEVPPDLTPLGFSGGHMVVTDWAVADAAGAHRCPSSTQGDRCDGRPVGGTRCDRCYRKDGGLVAFLVHGGAEPPCRRGRGHADGVQALGRGRDVRGPAPRLPALPQGGAAGPLRPGRERSPRGDPPDLLARCRPRGQFGRQGLIEEGHELLAHGRLRQADRGRGLGRAAHGAAVRGRGGRLRRLPRLGRLGLPDG
jgi:hypothetical protein